MKQACATALAVLAAAAPLYAGDGKEQKNPLDQLLETPISTAAKYDQQMSSVAASVTVITAEEIERYGWTSLAEVLQSVRGFYTTYDRSYLYVGLRGIGRPTDYNDRLLVLVNGHSTYDLVFGASPAGNDLAIDMGSVEKIEIIRGPGSAVYGTHAMLAVINVITKSADAIDGVSVSATAGSQGEKGGALRFGRNLPNGFQLTALANWQQSAGANLFFPEFNSPATNNGVAEGRDYESLHRLGFTLQRGGFRLDLSSRSRTKGAPTASFDTVFNADESMRNAQDLASIEYRGKIGSTGSYEARADWDRSRYHGRYQYDDVGLDHFVTETVRGEARLQWDPSPKQRIILGTEYSDVHRLYYQYIVGDYKINLNSPNDGSSYYLQYEAHPSPKWEVVAGIRRDDFAATADNTSPRAAILYTPNHDSTLKLLYGSAFRSPDIYESLFNDPLTPWKAHPDLKAETVRTTELVWEQRLSPSAMLVASAYHINAADLIDEQLEPTSQIYWYNNVGSLESNGAEAGLYVRQPNGLWYRFSGAMQRAQSDDQPATNSPRFLLKGGVSTSPWATWHGGLEGVYEASRRTRGGDETNPFLLLNGIVSRQLGEHFRLALSSRNLLNTHYSNPVGPELQQQSIRQDGRTFTLRLTYSR